ncbi:MAG: winged helix-turn-helix transcriptional regulator [Labilithrix sp.]|nr:winged helix-turn-helix transcriptional regulator [Labilithrix sp.]MBX3221323.1 winged helix-turn-helix transcriptional regulator [Labilithrix sp.]
MVTIGAERSAFEAIADPTRRKILDLVRAREMRAGDLAARFTVSRPAIAKHVRVLREAGLLRERREATQRFYTLEPKALESVDRWLAPYRLFWASRLMDLKHVVEEAAKTRTK